MDSTDSPDMTWYIVLEVLLGITLSIIFLIINRKSDNFWSLDYISGFIKIFAVSSLLFFLAVFSVGIIGAIKLKQSHKISKAIFYSILYWLSSLIGVAVLASVLYIFSLYFMLAGIVIGFNHGLKHKDKASDPKISN